MTAIVLTLLCSVAAAEHPLLGQLYPEPPAHLGPLLHAAPPPSIDGARAHLEAQDPEGALWEAQRYTDAHRWGRDRDLAWMVQGLVHREQRRHNLASAAFTRTRAGGGPLAAWGAYYEAEQDLARGRYWVAARECEAYRAEYRSGRHANDCHRVMALAYARAGAWAKAREVAQAYDSLNPQAPIGEQIELTLTLGLLREHPERAIERLQLHAVDFSAPLTGQVALDALADLRAAGHAGAMLPDDLASRKRRALSLRQTKQTAAAWQAFSDLAVNADEDPALGSWLDAEAETFGWRSRNWDFLERYYADAYASSGRAEDAWKRYRVLCRGGRYPEARQAALDALAAHPGHHSWRYKEEDLGQTFMLAGDHAGARQHFDALAKRGGWTGLRARYFAAFAGFMAGDDDADTLTRLDALVDKGGAFAHPARYWRAQLHERMGDERAARSDQRALLEEDYDSWYSALVRARLTKDDARVERRTGAWQGAPRPQAPVVTGEIPARRSASFALGIPTASSPTSRDSGSPSPFARVAWSVAPPPPTPEPGPVWLLNDPDKPPPSYVRSWFFDPEGGRARFQRWASRHRQGWPELEAALDLARAGLYDLSGPLFSSLYEEWRAAYRSTRHPKHAVARAMKLSSDEWRELFAVTRDHHHTARFHHGVWEKVEDPVRAREAKRIAYPLAHDRYVWTHSREHGIDPYLVLGLMRQESTYNSIARSPVGARGAMQIMPTTGHLLASLAGDLEYTAGDLEDPVFAVGYGIRYLGLLMERFDGVYPLAIASYNGGPFNVSSWLRGTGTDMPIDAFVEHIPFRETRDYVKRVSAGYSAYLTLYAPDGTLLAPPEKPLGDHPEVVDF